MRDEHRRQWFCEPRGWLWKEGENKGWSRIKNRFFRLQGMRLNYFTGPESATAKGSIILGNILQDEAARAMGWDRVIGGARRAGPHVGRVATP